MANDDKFSLYDNAVDKNAVGDTLGLTERTSALRDKRYLKDNNYAAGRKQPMGIHNDRAWKGGCQVDGCSQVVKNRWGQENFTNKATHLVTSLVDGDVSMKKVCGKHADEHLFTAQSAGHQILTGVEQKGSVEPDKNITIVARLTRRNNDAYLAHHGLEPETIGNVNGSGARRKIVQDTSNPSFVKQGSSWVPESSVEEAPKEKKKGGRPVGSGDSKPRKRRIPISEVRGDADRPKRGRGRPAGTKNNPDAPKRKKKAAEAPIKRMVNGREMTVTVIPENKRATERGMKFSRNGRNYKGSGTAV